jgi:2-oxoglutarate dehydrogenase E2 component (dihydrolipoamide succinyltransferase)
MKVEIKVPSIGESIIEAVVSNIIAPTGSVVAQEAEILELETDKVNQILYAPKGGQVNLTVKVGDTVKVGQVIGTVDTDVQAPAAAPPPKAEAPKPAPAPASAPVKEGPSARKMAPEFVSELKAPPPAPSRPSAPLPAATGSRKKMTALRRTIAQKLVEVKNTTAMLTTFNEADMSRIIAIRGKEQESFTEKYGVKLGFMSFFIKAAVAALKAFPDVNAYIDGDDIVYFGSYDISVAVSTDKGLMVPVIKNCDGLSFGGIEKELKMLAQKARDGKIAVEDLKGGSFTITNAGLFGSLISTPIINPPQSAILGMHNIVKRPVAVEDKVEIRPMMYLALSYDHRIIDGKTAVQFLVHMKENLEDPTRLLLEL